jgi:hypothetical protein
VSRSDFLFALGESGAPPRKRKTIAKRKSDRDTEDEVVEKQQRFREEELPSSSIAPYLVVIFGHTTCIRVFAI